MTKARKTLKNETFEEILKILNTVSLEFPDKMTFSSFHPLQTYFVALKLI